MKIRKCNEYGVVRLETSGSIKEVMINEDLINPNSESISFGFMGGNSSGIVEFTPKEFENLYRNIKSKLHLIKGAERLQ